MGVDWNQVVLNSQAAATEQAEREVIEGARLSHKLTESAASFLVGRRKLEADERAERDHQRELEAFHRFATDRVNDLSKPGHENPEMAAEWDRCRTEVCLGRWPSDSKILRADNVASLKFQALRVRLTPKPGDGPKRVYVENSMFAWS